MPHFVADGSIIQNSLSLGAKKSFFQKTKEKLGKVKCRVEEVLFVDDERNLTRNSANPQVEYNLTILGGPEAGRKIFNVKSSTPLGQGSPFNSGETILTPNLEGDQSKEGDHGKSADETTGSVVMVDYMHGHEGSAVITGCMKHPLSGFAATKEDGYRSVFEYAGFIMGVDKDGAFSMVYGGGPKDKDGKPANEDAAGTTMGISKAGSFAVSDGKGQGITIDKEAKKVSLESSQDLATSVGGNWDTNIKGSAVMKAKGNLDLAGAATNIGKGGLMSARMNDQVFGFDGEGRPINAWIGPGSSNVLVGG